AVEPEVLRPAAIRFLGAEQVPERAPRHHVVAEGDQRAGAVHQIARPDEMISTQLVIARWSPHGTDRLAIIAPLALLSSWTASTARVLRARCAASAGPPPTASATTNSDTAASSPRRRSPSRTSPVSATLPSCASVYSSVRRPAARTWRHPSFTPT